MKITFLSLAFLNNLYENDRWLELSLSSFIFEWKQQQKEPKQYISKGNEWKEEMDFIFRKLNAFYFLSPFKGESAWSPFFEYHIYK